jgi:hypothetical protein
MKRRTKRGALPKQGTGRRHGSSLAHQRALAARLTSINNMEPWICVFQHTPNRWSYGIRFYPVDGAKVEHLTGPDYGSIIRPVEKGANHKTMAYTRRS